MNRVHWVIDDGECLVHERIRRDSLLPLPSALRPPEGFIDFSPGLRHGIYALILRTKIVFLGSSARPLEMIAAHRDRSEHPSWLPFRFIEFDQVWIKSTSPDRAEAELAELIRHHRPIYNTKRPS